MVPAAIALFVLLELPAEEQALIERELEAAQQEVLARHGNRPLTELPLEERQVLRVEQAEAERRVLDTHGVSARDWVRSQSRRSREVRATVTQTKRALDEKAAQATKETEGQSTGAAEPRDIPVQRGFNDENPVVLEQVDGAPPAVEQGLPSEAADDSTLAADFDKADQKGDAPARKPSGGRQKAKRGR